MKVVPIKVVCRLGFWKEDVEVKPGVYQPQIYEKEYPAEVMRNIRRFDSVADQQNSDLTINNRISIISDLYLQYNWSSIKYALWNGVKWSVTSVDVLSYPRVILDLGGIYNGESATA